MATTENKIVRRVVHHRDWEAIERKAKQKKQDDTPRDTFGEITDLGYKVSDAYWKFVIQDLSNANYKAAEFVKNINYCFDNDNYFRLTTHTEQGLPLANMSYPTDNKDKKMETISKDGFWVEVSQAMSLNRSNINAGDLLISATVNQSSLSDLNVSATLYMKRAQHELNKEIENWDEEIIAIQNDGMNVEDLETKVENTKKRYLETSLTLNEMLEYFDEHCLYQDEIYTYGDESDSIYFFMDKNGTSLHALANKINFFCDAFCQIDESDLTDEHCQNLMACFDEQLINYIYSDDNLILSDKWEVLPDMLHPIVESHIYEMKAEQEAKLKNSKTMGLK